MESSWDIQKKLIELNNSSKFVLKDIGEIDFGNPNDENSQILQDFRDLNISAADDEDFQKKFSFLYLLRDLNDAFYFLRNKQNEFLSGSLSEDEILKKYNLIVDKLLAYSYLWKDENELEQVIEKFTLKYSPQIFAIWQSQFQATDLELDSKLHTGKVKRAKFLEEFGPLAQQLLNKPQPSTPSSPLAKMRAKATSFLSEEKSNPSLQLLESINSIIKKPLADEKKAIELHETLTAYKSKLSEDERVKVNTLLKYLEEHLPKDYQATIEKSGSNKVYDDLTQILTISSPPQSSWKNTANVFKSKIFSPTEKTDRSEYILSKTKEIIDNKTTTTEEQKLTAIRDLLNTEINNLDPSKQYPISLLISKIENMLPKVIPSGPTKRS